MSDASPLLQTELGDTPLIARGKVRDIFALGADELLFVATDRISAFDHVLGSGIPDKGTILTQLSLFWFDFLLGVAPNHVITANVDQFPRFLAPFRSHLAGRSMIVKRAEMFPVECVVRGYLSGSGWKDYQQTGTLCGIALPHGLRESEQLPVPLFTPAAKNHIGHDENIAFDKVVERVGSDTAERLRALSLAIYERARSFAATKGLILADTKFEFGTVTDEHGATQILLADEVLTPDSTRYWPAESYRPGGAQPSFDKQYVRDYLERIGWNKQAPAPALPADVVENTRRRYLEAYTLLTGEATLPAI